MDTKKAQELLAKFKDGTLTKEEDILLDEWYRMLGSQRSSKVTKFWMRHKKQMIWSKLDKQRQNSVKIKIWPRFAIAASLVICFCASLYVYKLKKDQRYLSLASYKTDIPPGRNKAFLTLANGKKISLTDTKNGEIARQSGIEINKTEDGQIIYKMAAHSSSVRNGQTLLNTIETPRGGQYQIILPDGSKVYLNAASSLKYPISFAALKERKVELIGEAYFEVAHNEKQPFKVKTAQQEVEVIGTHFNINCYTNEPAVNTTLLQGSVKITTGSNTVMLKPGQQSSLIRSNLSSIRVIDNVDTQEITAWKNGFFQFSDADLATIMRQLSRWYDTEVVFEGKIPSSHYIGKVPRTASISGVLSVLEASGLNFKIEGRKIIVK